MSTPHPTPYRSFVDVVIVGAGLSGLVAAHELTRRGASVAVVDKGRSPGGRLATRYAESDRGRATWDHGAQFFTVRSDVFGAMITDWPVSVWHHGPDRAADVHTPPDQRRAGGDGHPRYVGMTGMNGIAKHLAADLDVATGVRVTHVTATEDDRWRAAADGRTWTAAKILITCPVPQTADLLPDELQRAVPNLTYDPCLALLAVLDRSPVTTAVQFDGGPVHYIADNTSKSISDATAVTVHAGGEWSRAHYDDSDEALTLELTELARPWFGTATVVESQIKRWRYAQPTSPHPQRALELAPGLVLAGDTFGEAKVEGAARSGLAAADLLSG